MSFFSLFEQFADPDRRNRGPPPPGAWNPINFPFGAPPRGGPPPPPPPPYGRGPPPHGGGYHNHHHHHHHRGPPPPPPPPPGARPHGPPPHFPPHRGPGGPPPPHPFRGPNNDEGDHPPHHHRHHKHDEPANSDSESSGDSEFEFGPRKYDHHHHPPGRHHGHRFHAGGHRRNGGKYGQCPFSSKRANSSKDEENEPLGLDILNNVLSSLGLAPFLPTGPDFYYYNNGFGYSGSEDDDDDESCLSEDNSEMYTDPAVAAQKVSAAEGAISEAASNIETLKAEHAAVRIEESDAKKKYRELHTKRRSKDVELRKAYRQKKAAEKKLNRAKKAVKSFEQNTSSSSSARANNTPESKPFASGNPTLDNVLNALIPVVDTVIKNLNDSEEPGTSAATPSVSKTPESHPLDSDDDVLDFTGTELDVDETSESKEVPNLEPEQKPNSELEPEPASSAESTNPTVEEPEDNSPSIREVTDSTFAKEIESSSTDAIAEEDPEEQDVASTLQNFKKVLDRNIESYNNVYHAVMDEHNDAFTPESSEDEGAGDAFKLPMKTYVLVLERVQRKFEQVYSSLDELDVPKSKSLRRMKHGLTGLSVSYSDKTQELLDHVKASVSRVGNKSDKTNNDLSETSSVSSWTNVKSSKGRKIEIEDAN